MKYSDKVFIIFFVLVSALSGSDKVDFRFSGDKYFTEEILLSVIKGNRSPEQSIEGLIDHYADKGFPFVSVKIDSIRLYDQCRTVFVTIDSGDYIRIDDIIFKGAAVTKKESLTKLAGIIPGEKFSETRIKEASEWLFRSGFFEKRPDFEIISTGPDRYGVSFGLSEKKYNEIMFLGGFNSDDGGSTLTVHSLLKAGNLFGTMRKFRLLWEREGETYEKLKFYYREPFLAGIRLSTEAEYGQIFRKNAYLKRNFLIGQKYTYGPGSGITYGIEKEYFYSDTLKTDGSPESVITSYRTGIEYNTSGENVMIPEEAGTSVRAEFSTVNIDKRSTADQNGIELLFSAEKNISMTRNLLFRMSVTYNQMIFDDDLPDYARLVFGGADSFRGYREDTFISDIYILNSADFYITDNLRSAAIDVFTDVCSYNQGSGKIKKIKELESLISYGIGIIYRTSSGQISVHAAVPHSEGFSETVVHARYAFRF